APISVSIPTQAEFATYGDSGEDGIWLNVIEKAFAKSKIASMPDADEDMMYDKISGGRPGASIQLLTGHKARRFSFASENTRSVIRSELSNALADHRLVTTSIKTIKKDGTKGGHALAVLSYEPGFDQVKIWNPWGTSGRYKSVGIKMESGIFTMSVEEWLGRFSSATIEQ
ncbi:MAG: hypothetical protein K2X29_11070, partial [Candidatus Obscuribacterales bacterium]|nr:hypothetical protein [Candidatus Obscuribacterales bacterium]